MRYYKSLVLTGPLSSNIAESFTLKMVLELYLVPKAELEWEFISYTYSTLSISPTINQSQIKFSTNFYHSIF